MNLNPADMLKGLLSATRGTGPSTTRFTFLAVMHSAIVCAVAMTAGGIYVYVAKACNADTVYWGAVIALWMSLIGWVTGAKKHQADRTAEITAETHHPGVPKA